MITVRTIAELRAAVAAHRRTGGRVGFVPTMGYFHEGHLTLMRRARERCGFTVVSLFVNPTQFNDARDLEAYPRDEARDAGLARDAGVDVLFVPGVEEMYPPGALTSVEVAGITAPLEGRSRGASHFRGVATVVTKLFNIVQPDVAFFGQKDAQQSLMIRRMVVDLDLPLAVEVVPTVREPDGLAMSSRNVRLDRDARPRALGLSRALFAIERAVADGDRDTERLLQVGRDALGSCGIAAADIEYLAAVDADTLEHVPRIEAPTLVAVAARVGGVRLIDNLVVAP